MPATGSLCTRARGFTSWQVFTREEQSASKEDEEHCSSWNGSSLGWEVETCLGGDGSPLGR